MDLFEIDATLNGVVEPENVHTEVMFAAIGNRELVPESVVEAAKSHGIALRKAEQTTRLGDLNRLLSSRPVSFIVGALDPDRVSLIDCTPITTGNYPPLVLVHDVPMTPDMQEKMRRAGVTAVVHRDAPPEEFASIAAELARSWAWVRVPLGRVDVPGAIQRVAGLGDELCLTIECPHVSPLMHDPWRALSPCTGHVGCRGWFGRIYIRSGMIMSAETPAETGIAAMASLMELRDGQVLCHEVFLPPAEDNIGLPMDAALLHAATYSDHRAAGIEAAS